MLHREEDLNRIKQFRLLDDDFMSKVFEDNIEATQLLIDKILERTDIIVKSVKTQDDRKTVNGHSVRFDIYAEDSIGKPYDIEIQRSDKGAVPQRARYNSSVMDTYLLEKGKSYSNLKDSYTIFITENDVFKKNLPLYHIERKILETDELFDDGSHIIFVNGQYVNNETDIGKLMHDFRCTDADDMFYNVLAERVRYFKETEGGSATMCRMMEDMRNEAANEKAIENAKSMLKDNLPLEKVAKYSGLSTEEIEAIKVKHKL